MFRDIRVIPNSPFKDRITSAIESVIEKKYGGIFNILNLINLNEMVYIYADKRSHFPSKKNINFINKFRSIPEAVIIETNKRQSYVKKGSLLNNRKKILIKKNHTALVLYAECFSDFLINNSGTVVMDYNHSGWIIPKKLIIQNLNNTNYILGSFGELKWIFDIERKYFFKDLIIIEHSPEKYKIHIPINRNKRKCITLKNNFFKKNAKQVTGLGDMFALLFTRNLSVFDNYIDNVENVSKDISIWLD